ncbi:MAG: SRPBCC family protein [Cyanobium sp.]
MTFFSRTSERAAVFVLTLAIVGSSAATTARAADSIDVDPILRTRKSVIIDRPCNKVWPYLADFSAIGRWYKAFRSVRHYSGTPGQLGEVREIVRASNGQLVREKLIYLDPISMELGYTHVLNPPVRDNITLVSMAAAAQGQCQISWSNTYRLKPGQNPAEPPAFFSRAYGNVLANLKEFVEANTQP